MTIIVRPLEPTDHDRWAVLFRGYRDFYAREPDEAVVEAVWGWLAERRAGLAALVAEAQGDLVGIAHYSPVIEPWMAETVLHLHDLFVDPQARGSGAASALLAQLAEIAAAGGHAGVEWVTDAGNARARRLYDRIAEASEWVTYFMPPTPSAPAAPAK